MIVFLSALALSPALAAGPACDPAAAVVDVRAGERDAYLCVIKSDDGRDVLLKALDDGGAFPERLTRALGLWMLQRSGDPMDPALVRRLSPADRRLLMDGIKARRGRASPVPEHDAVFAQFSWYAPDPTYTDDRLRPVDRANLAVLDRPPAPDVPAAGLDEEAPSGLPAAADAGPSAPASPGLCGCASAANGGGAALALLLALAAATRRR